MVLDMDKRSKVINLCNWSVSFKLPNSHAEVILGAKKSTTINNAELVTLADNQDIMFCGTDRGDHARVYVDSEEFRKYVGFDDTENKHTQFVLTDEECKKIFDLKTESTFKKHLEEKVVMNHEKDIIMNYARKNKCNDYNRIKLLEEHTGFKF